MVLTLHLCVGYGSQKKWQLLPHTTLRDRFCVTEVESENCTLLAYNVTSSGNFLLTFWDKLSVPLSGGGGSLTLEEGTNRSWMSVKITTCYVIIQKSAVLIYFVMVWNHAYTSMWWTVFTAEQAPGPYTKQTGLIFNLGEVARGIFQPHKNSFFCSCHISWN